MAGCYYWTMAGATVGRAIQRLLERATIPLGGEHLRCRPLQQVHAEGSQIQRREPAKLRIVERLAARMPPAPTATR